MTIQESLKKAVRVVTKESPEYPSRMRELPDMPDRLYVRGNLPGDEPAVAIIGTRGCSFYGQQMAELFGREMGRRGVTIISGMAHGVDSMAQMAAVRAGGKSYAVLAGGPDICYPASSRGLYEELLETGGILSEHPGGEMPKRWYFPLRNRLISALADIVLVIEAPMKSGTLITVDYALDMGRTVFAVPGRVGDLRSEGCLHLIGQGAGAAISPEVVLRELETLTHRDLTRQDQTRRDEDHDDGAALSPDEKRLLGAFDGDPVSLPMILDRTGFAPPDAARLLGTLIDRGLIEEPFGHVYVLTLSGEKFR